MSTRRFILAMLGCASIAILTGCGSSSKAATSAPPATVQTADQIATDLSALGCTASPSDTSWVNMGIVPVRSLDCTMNGEDVSIDQYASAQQVASQMNLVHADACTFMKPFGITDAEFVLADNTMISTNTASTAQSIRLAIDDPATKMDSIHCS